MATNHKILVDFARSTTRKINVDITNPEWREYLETNFKKIYGCPSGGAVRTDVVITITVTAVVLILIALAVMLSLNG